MFLENPSPFEAFTLRVCSETLYDSAEFNNHTPPRGTRHSYCKGLLRNPI